MKLPFFNEIKGRADERVACLESLYALADDTRRLFESDWYTNVLFLAGNQWEAAHEDMRRFRRLSIQAPSTKVRIVSNQVLPLARQAASALRENIAQQVAVPASGDMADVQAAALATDLLQHRFNQDREEQLRTAEILSVMCFGRVLRKTFWDPDLPGEGVPSVANEDGSAPKLGDVSTVTINPFRFHLCPWAGSSDEQPWIIESDVRDIDEINALYPGHDVNAEEYDNATWMLDRLATNVLDSAQPSTAPRKNAAILKRLYYRPDSANPLGKLFVWAAGKLLLETELPEGRMPFVCIDWFPIPERIYPLPFITPLRDMQREINIILSQLVELKNRQLRGDMVITGHPPTEEDQGPVSIETDERTGAKRIYVQPGSGYEFMQYNLNANEAHGLKGEFWNDMMQDAGIHESALGQQPGKDVTATQITSLKESDMSGLSFFRRNFDEAYCDVARLKLIVCRNHYKVPRIIRLVRPESRMEVRAFFGTDLRNTEDVIARPVPILTETQKQALRTALIQHGVYGPYVSPQDMLAKLMVLLNSGLPDARDEVDAILGGEMSLDSLHQVCATLNKFMAMGAVMQAEMAVKGVAEEMEGSGVRGQ